MSEENRSPTGEGGDTRLTHGSRTDTRDRGPAGTKAWTDGGSKGVIKCCNSRGQ